MYIINVYAILYYKNSWIFILYIYLFFYINIELFNW